MPDVQPIPDGYPRITASLSISPAPEGGAAAAIDFYTSVFGMKERMRMPGPAGKVGHAELALGDSLIMLADEFPEMGFVGPRTVGGSPVTLSLYVEDVDAMVAKAVDAGATVTQPVADQFYGDRSGQLEDPFGHRWNLATHVEDVPEEEMARRVAEMMGG